MRDKYGLPNGPYDIGTGYDTDYDGPEVVEDSDLGTDDLLSGVGVFPIPCTKFMVISAPENDTQHHDSSTKNCFFLVHVEETVEMEIDFSAESFSQSKELTQWFSRYGVDEETLKQHWATVSASTIRNALTTIITDQFPASPRYFPQRVPVGYMVIKGAGFIINNRELLDLVAAVRNDPGLVAKTLSMPGHSWFIQTVTLSNCVSFDLIEKVVPCKSFYRPSPPVPGRENRDVSILRGGPDVPCYFFLVHVAKKRANGTISYLGKEHTATRRRWTGLQRMDTMRSG